MGALTKFGPALRALRGGRSLETVAKAAGVTISNLSKYELEQKWPSREVLERVLEGLGGLSLLDLAAEVDRQQRLARGELPETPPPPPPDFEERMRQVAIEVFTSGLTSLLGLPSADLDVFAASVRAEGMEPGSGGAAVIQAVLEILKGRAG